MYKWKAIYFFSSLTSLLINNFKNHEGQVFKKILVIRLDEIGDMITTLPVFDHLKKKFPNAEITVWCLPLTAQLLKYNTAIHKVVFNKNELTEKYDLVVDLRGDFKTMWYALTHLPKIRLDRGTVRFRNKFLMKQHPHEVYTNLQVLQPVIGKIDGQVSIELPFGKENENAAVQFLEKNSIRKFAILHSGARKLLRRLPGEKFASTAKYLKEKYNLDIVFVGTDDELGDIKKIQEQINFPTYVFNGYSLLDFAALSSKASVMIGNESGPMHLAAAVNIPVIGLFGPGEPHVFAPYGKKTTFIHHKLECNPCDQIHCVHPEFPCMYRITAEEIIEKLSELPIEKSG
ncbi:MAG TPA: glycosyltransferase family 9 protein [Bacteroidia bacterium]|nr:glycosyltransferase family 9 protein [Bacteroidia bacterium]